ncbi:40S ribosomal protein S7 [Capsicum baccatum]|uniref:40S ribosomal protein S7 n=2 Tax=Capsicum TaxID=4071 RepID=A0A2G2WLL2_CAPBA|nr:40S ribosomal protein S7 [Capsicum baccatum]
MNRMHVTQFYDHAKADQAINNNNNNNISSPLKINKASHLIRKSSSNSLIPSSSSSSSLYNAVVATTIPHQQPRHPVIIYTHSPKVIHTHPRDFMALVQKLTGLSPEDDPSSPSPPLQTMPQHPKSEPINEEEEEEDPISGPEGCLGDILRLDDQENTYHDNNMTNNNINQKCDLVVNDDNECTSVVTDENNGSCSIGDNSSASCYVPPPPIFDLVKRSARMYTSRQKIHKDKDAEPTEFEESVAQAFFDLENTNQELKSELKDLYINSASQIDVSGGSRKAVVIHVPYRLRKAFRKVHVRLVRELEKKFSGKDVIFIATRRIMRPPKRGSAAQRPRSRTLTSVHDAILEDLVVPAEIVGKRTRYRVDGSKIMKVFLDPKERNNTEYKLETFSAVYRKLSGKDVVFEYPTEP